VNLAAYGKERAAIVSMDDLRLLDRLDIEDARAALKEAEGKGNIALRDLMRELGD
jgi:hypothetical protein